MTKKHLLLPVLAAFLAFGCTSNALGEKPQFISFTDTSFDTILGIPVRVDRELQQIARDGENFIEKNVYTYTNLQTGQAVELRARFYYTNVVVDDGNSYMIQVTRRGNAQFFVAGNVVPVTSGYLEITETWYGYPTFEYTREVKLAGPHAEVDYLQELHRLLSL